MFLDDSAFDVDADISKNSSGAAPSFSMNQGRHMSVPAVASSRQSFAPVTLNDIDDIEEEDDYGGSGFGSAGGITAPSSSRARMLAQQRELQLKKRQAAIQSSGVIRSSSENVNFQENKSDISALRNSTDSQFTPAVRQFSAPKAVKESSADVIEATSEFGRSSTFVPANKPAAARPSKRYDDDEDETFEDRDYRASDQRMSGRRDSGRGGARWDEDDDGRDSRGGNRNGRGNGRAGRGYDDYEV